MKPDDAVKILREQQTPWDDVRQQRILVALLNAKRESSRFRPRMRLVAAFGTVAAVVIVVFLLSSDRIAQNAAPLLLVPASNANLPPKTQPEVTSTLDLAGAGKAFLSAGAIVSIKHRSKFDLQLVQTHGYVRYELKSAPGRVMKVHAGAVTVKVIGTIFTLDKNEDTVRVTVKRGVVKVADGRREVTLEAGEEIAMQSEPTDTLDDKLNSAVLTEEIVEKTDQDKSSRPGIRVLLRQSDQARLEGDYERAALLLRQIIREFPSSPRLANVLFTLGNVEKNRGKLLRAARSYKRCRKMSPKGPLTEDAYAQEAFCLDLAGQFGQAKRAARQYLRLYPTGTHANRMRRMIR